MPIPPKFTDREIEIIPFLVSGATRVEIADHFGLSDETVKKHVRNILNKFDATSLRDCISDITQYHDHFIKGMHQFYVPHLTTTLHLHENYKDCEIASEYEVLAIKPNVSKITELYATDGDLPRVEINGEITKPTQELMGHLFTWMFPRTLQPFETQSIYSRVFFSDAFGANNEESHFNNIADPTGHLTLAVVFHTERILQKVSFEVRHGRTTREDVELIERPAHNKYRISISEPEYLKRYYVRWVWET